MVEATEAEAAGSRGAGAEAEEPEPRPGPTTRSSRGATSCSAPVTARLSRTVKRALGDDQNRLLDRCAARNRWPATSCWAPRTSTWSLFAGKARGHLAEAFTAGTMFAGAEAAAVPEGDAVEESSAALARVIVTMLRRQMEEGTGEPVDRVGAAFREWRGERVERLAGDYATQAFSAGVAAAGAEGKMRWVVTSTDGCSDCEDNELAGAVSGIEVFPTGHLHPPAHSGCRCLVAPVGDELLTAAADRIATGALAVGSQVADVRLPPCASPAI